MKSLTQTHLHRYLQMCTLTIFAGLFTGGWGMAQEPDYYRPTVRFVKGQDQTPQQPDDSILLRTISGSWRNKDIREIRVDITETSDNLPKDYSEQIVNLTPLAWSDFQATSKLFAWAAPNIQYQPLYFEDVALERYGQTKGEVRQFFASAIHFGTSAILLPHHMRFDPPWSCDYPLGFCRPGGRNPAIRERHFWGFYRKYKN